MIRAKKVYESFNRGVDPKNAIGLGLDPRNEEVFIQFVVTLLPKYLSRWSGRRMGPTGLPYDILHDNLTYLNRHYLSTIEGPIREYISARLGVPSKQALEDLPYNLWKSLASALYDLGYTLIEVP